jgi:hypothetical protein
LVKKGLQGLIQVVLVVVGHLYTEKQTTYYILLLEAEVAGVTM